MIKLPPDNTSWRVDNASDLRGYLNFTQGIHFDNDGYLSFVGKTTSVYSENDDANFDLPLKMLYFNSKYFVLTYGDCWEISSDLTFTNITDAESNRPDPDRGSDAVIWQNRVYVSSDTTTDVRYWSGTAWTDPSIALSSDNVPHPLEVMGNFSQGHLVVGEDNTVKRYDDSHSLQATLTINSNYEVTCLLYRQNNLYIGTRAVDGGKAKVFVWNGSGTAASSEYDVNSDWVFSIVEYGSSFVIANNAGQLLRWNGGGFEPLRDSLGRPALFPVYNTQYRWTRDLTNENGPIVMNGMVADGERLYIAIDGAVGGMQKIGSTTFFNRLFLPEQPSGVWCFDPDIGLYCRNLFSTDEYTAFTASALNSNTLTLSGDTNAVTGDPVEVRDNGSLTGVNDNTTYYVIKVADNQIKIAETLADAEAGTAITLGGSVTSATFVIPNYNQVGESLTGEAGCVALLTSENTSNPVFDTIFKSRLLFGFNDNNSVDRLNVVSETPGIGFFSTEKLTASGIKDSWQKIYTLVDDLFGSYDKIIYRYKTKERQSFPTPPIVGTYSGPDTIGTTDNRIDLAEEGDSVHIISGNGAGNIRTIKSITGDEILLTESLTGVSSSDSVTFYIDSWKECVSASSTSSTATAPENYLEGSVGKTSSWIKFLIEGRGKLKIRQLRVINDKAKQNS